MNKWFIVEHDDFFEIREQFNPKAPRFPGAPTSSSVAHVSKTLPLAAKRDATLIAAAPEMLEALKLVYDKGDTWEVRQLLKTVIAKAEGK